MSSTHSFAPAEGQYPEDAVEGRLGTAGGEDQERLVWGLMQRFGRSETEARDTVLTGSVAQIQDKLGRLQAAGVDQLYIPTFLPPWNLEQLDRFMTEVAPAFR